VNGRSSTRKSYFIRLLFYKFIKIGFLYKLLTFIICTTLISITANNINSYTLYSFL
ncbi:hypothetical protein QR685DRAFT_429865, partial [Neurospora intermedia]